MSVHQMDAAKRCLVMQLWQIARTTSELFGVTIGIVQCAQRTCFVGSDRVPPDSHLCLTRGGPIVISRSLLLLLSLSSLLRKCSCFIGHHSRTVRT
jgi:hypothetical protein